MKTRIVYPKNLWFNKEFKALKSTTKVVCLYLVTNENIGLSPIYKQQDLEICFKCGISEKQLEEIKGELTGLFYFKDEWVYINNEFTYCDYQGQKKVMESKAREEKSIPPYVKAYFKGVKEGLDTPSGVSINPKPKTINNNKGVVKGGNYPSTDSLGEEEFRDIADKYKVPLAFVRSKLDDMVNWEGAKGGRQYQNYYLALSDWVKKDALKIKQDYAKQTNDVAL